MTSYLRLLSVCAAVIGLCLTSSANGLTFTDPFDDLDGWTLFGTPSPQRLASQSGATGVFDNNGDDTDISGAVSTRTFGLAGGFTIQSDVYLDFSDTMGCNAEASIGIADTTNETAPHIYFSINAVGHGCGTIAAALRGHAYFFGGFKTASGSETFYPTEPSPLLFRADQYANGWHTLKIIVNASSQIKFYIDTVLVYTGSQNISSTIASGAYPLWLGSQSSGDAGKAYHDNITITAACDPPSAPNLSSPSANAIVCATSVSFNWNDVVGATDYQFQVDDDVDFGTPIADLGFTPPTHSVSVTLSNSCLPNYWRVRAKNSCNWGEWSAVRTVTVCSSPSGPTLATPADDATDIEQPVVLNWNDVSGISYYQVQVDTSSGFAHPVIDHNRTISIDSVAQLTGSTEYFWRVRAASGCATSTWSSTFSFTTAVCDVPAAPTLLTPANADSGETQPVTLDWSDAATALSYRVQVDDDSTFASAAIDNQVSNSTTDVTGLASGTRFFWRVRPYNGCGWGEWSAANWFKTCYLVGAPVLVLPADGDTVTNKPVSFDWNNVATASKYQFQVDDTITFVSPLIDEQVSASQFGSYDLEYETRYYWRVRAFGTCGWGSWSAAHTCTTSASLIVEVVDGGALPETFGLSQNYPNPFNPSTAIEFRLPRPGFVTLEVYDIVGRKVRTLVSEPLTAGVKRTIWDGCDMTGVAVASGVYFYRLEAGEFRETRKMVLLK